MAGHGIEALEPRYLCAGGFGYAIEIDHALSAADDRGNVFLAGAGVEKLDPRGHRIWWRQFDGASVNAVALDEDRNIFIAGRFSGSVDFDPGPGKKVVRTAGRIGGDPDDADDWPPTRAEDDIFAAKLDPRGNLLWVRTVAGTGYDESATAIAVDAQGNVVITGSFSGTADFDPRVGKGAILTARGRPHDYELPRDAFVWKLDSGGRLRWARQFDVFEPDPWFRSDAELGLDGPGNVLLAGEFSNAVDFDPGPEEHLLLGRPRRNGSDSFLLKLDPDGAFVWARKSKARIEQLAVGPDGHGYVLGDLHEPADLDPGPGRSVADPKDGPGYVSRLTPDGNLDWFYQTHVSFTDADATTDREGNLFATGTHLGTADFDPGPMVRTLPIRMPAGDISRSNETFVWKLSPARGLEWIASTRSSNGSPRPSRIAVTAEGAVFTAGTIWRKTDFDPGPGRHFVTPYVALYDLNGATYLWKLLD